jgi:hypothetical protein
MVRCASERENREAHLVVYMGPDISSEAFDPRNVRFSLVNNHDLKDRLAVRIAGLRHQDALNPFVREAFTNELGDGFAEIVKV